MIKARNFAQKKLINLPGCQVLKIIKLLEYVTYHCDIEFTMTEKCNLVQCLPLGFDIHRGPLLGKEFL